MKSNGFGSLEQSIIIHVPTEQAKQLALKLGIEPFKEDGSPSHSYFLWKRLTTRAGNDEDVVYDLDMILGDTEHKLGWKIDWNASEY